MATAPNHDAGGNGEAIPDLGHPIHVFIDTSTFEDLNFAFGSPLFAALLERVQAGEVRVVLSEITHREVSLRLTRLAKEAETGIAHAKRLARVLGEQIEPLDAVFEWDQIQHRLDQIWAQFIKDAQVELLPVGSDDGVRVVRDYFATKPPFAGGKKKNEFPDAFAIAALRRFSKAQSRKIAVISGDRDFVAACGGDDDLVHFPNLPALLEHAARIPQFDPEELHALLEKHRAELESPILESFADRGFFWDSDEGHDSEVVETYEEELESWTVAVIDVESGRAEIAGDVTITFKASATYPDPDMMYRDDETKELVSIGNVTATLSATVTVPITFGIDIKKLRQGKLEWSDLVVNNNGDVWFSEDEIEEISRPDYSQ